MLKKDLKANIITRNKEDHFVEAQGWVHLTFPCLLECRNKSPMWQVISLYLEDTPLLINNSELKSLYNRILLLLF